ncbi:hypothetical protein QTP88_011130 [Uroleucon formosanum]
MDAGGYCGAEAVEVRGGRSVGGAIVPCGGGDRWGGLRVVERCCAVRAVRSRGRGRVRHESLELFRGALHYIHTHECAHTTHKHTRTHTHMRAHTQAHTYMARGGSATDGGAKIYIFVKNSEPLRCGSNESRVCACVCRI